MYTYHVYILISSVSFGLNTYKSLISHLASGSLPLEWGFAAGVDVGRWSERFAAGVGLCRERGGLGAGVCA